MLEQVIILPEIFEPHVLQLVKWQLQEGTCNLISAGGLCVVGTAFARAMTLQKSLMLVMEKGKPQH